jgi:hypothetical protein
VATDSYREAVALAAVTWYRARLVDLLLVKGVSGAVADILELTPSNVLPELLRWMDGGASPHQRKEL